MNPSVIIIGAPSPALMRLMGQMIAMGIPGADAIVIFDQPAPQPARATIVVDEMALFPFIIPPPLPEPDLSEELLIERPRYRPPARIKPNVGFVPRPRIHDRGKRRR